jgi:hypothetical protein
MSLAAALLLAAVAAPAASTDAHQAPNRGAQVDSAQISVRILRPVVMKNGRLPTDPNARTPHSQRQAHDGRITYEFE